MNENGSTRLYGNLIRYYHTLNHSLLSSIFSYRPIQGFPVSFGEVCILPLRYGLSSHVWSREIPWIYTCTGLLQVNGSFRKSCWHAYGICADTVILSALTRAIRANEQQGPRSRH